MDRLNPRLRLVEAAQTMGANPNTVLRQLRPAISRDRARLHPYVFLHERLEEATRKNRPLKSRDLNALLKKHPEKVIEANRAYLEETMLGYHLKKDPHVPEEQRRAYAQKRITEYNDKTIEAIRKYDGKFAPKRKR
ncbi:hypothetical protein HZC09_01755 [Candidatus Micrarchaeota archaeon]|nr:hypothetical protein [Candidatus Micrarchaeota archaeon]